MSAGSSEHIGYRGEHGNEKGVFYEVKRTGGPGNYPYTKKYFVPDSAAGKVDTRHQSNLKPWEVPGAVEVKL